jgi:hypothetical protein
MSVRCRRRTSRSGVTGGRGAAVPCGQCQRQGEQRWRNWWHWPSSKPGALNYGSAGIGSIAPPDGRGDEGRPGHLRHAHIPFRGSGASVPAMVGGQVDMVFASPPALTGFVQAPARRKPARHQRLASAPTLRPTSRRWPRRSLASTSRSRSWCWLADWHAARRRSTASARPRSPGSVKSARGGRAAAHRRSRSRRRHA